MGKIDTVVDTFSLCVRGNDGAKKCVDQMKNIVKPQTGQIPSPLPRLLILN